MPQSNRFLSIILITLLHSEPGFANSSCNIDHYLSSGICVQCPVGSTSLAGATSRLECLCQAGYTGVDGGPCVPCGPGSFRSGTSSVQISDANLARLCGENLQTRCVISASSTSPGFLPSFANDGIEDATDGFWASTEMEANPYFVLDLEQTVQISTVKLLVSNSTADSLTSQEGISIRVGGGSELSSSSYCATNQQVDLSEGSAGRKVVVAPCSAAGRYVFVSLDGTRQLGLYEIYAFQDLCTKCPEGEFTNASASAACETCPSTYVSLAERTACACDKGYAFLNYSSVICEICPEWTYKATVGNSECIPCDNEYARAPRGSTSLSQCLCLAGYGALTQGEECFACAQGKYNAGERGGLEAGMCKACPDNAYSPERSTSLGQCTCEAGYSGNDGGECLPCPQGTYKPLRGSGACTTCPNIGAFSREGSTSASDCVGGELAQQCSGDGRDAAHKTYWCPYRGNELTWCGTAWGPENRVRVGHSAVAMQGFVVLFGGFVYDDGYKSWGKMDDATYVLENSAPRLAWIKLGKQLIKPAARWQHTAVVHGHTMIIYGGRAALLTDDVADPWSFDLTTLAWTKQSCSGTAPHVLDDNMTAASFRRFAHSSVMKEDEMLVFGGASELAGSRCQSELWSLNISTWTWSLLNVGGEKPLGLCWHSAAIVDGKMIVAGGYRDQNLSSPSMAVYELDMEGLLWTITQASPPAHVNSAVLHGSSLYLLIGDCQIRACQLMVLTADTHEVSPVNVTFTSASSFGWHGLAALGWRRQAVVSAGDSLIAIGGGNSKSFSAFRLTAQSSASSLTVNPIFFSGDDSLMVSSSVPQRRERFGMSVSEAGKVVMFGGMQSTFTAIDVIAFSYLDDLWLLDLEAFSWQPITVSGPVPSARQGHTLVFCGSSMLMFGGAHGYVSPSRWLPCPECASGRESVAHSDGSRYKTFSDTWQLNLTTWEWNLMTVIGPSGREGHTAVVVEGKMVVYGGVDLNSTGTVQQFDDLWVFDHNSWTQVRTSSEAPGSLFDHSVVVDDSKMILFGGCRLLEDGTLWFNPELWVLDIDVGVASYAWTRQPTATQAARAGHSAVVVGSSIVLFGGYGLSMRNSCATTQTVRCIVSYHDTWRVSTTDMSWTEVVTRNPPSPRRYHNSFFSGTDVFVYGGGEEWLAADAGIWRMQFSEIIAVPMVLKPHPESDFGVVLSLAWNFVTLQLVPGVQWSGGIVHGAQIVVEPAPGATVSLDASLYDSSVICNVDSGCLGLAIRRLHFDGTGQARTTRLFQVTGETSSMQLEQCTFTNVSCHVVGCVVASLSGASVTVRQTSVVGGHSVGGGAVGVIDAEAMIISSRFADYLSDAGGGAVVVRAHAYLLSPATGMRHSNFQPRLVVRDANFTGNKASGGGGALLCDTDCDCAIMNTSFVSNVAVSDSSGGAIFSRQASLAVSRSAFRDNTAQGGGGALFWQDHRPSLDISDLNLCEPDTRETSPALYGPCVASNPVNTTLGDSDSYVLTNQYAGVELNPPISIRAYDFYGQTVKLQGVSKMVAHLYIADPSVAMVQGPSAVTHWGDHDTLTFYGLWIFMAVAAIDATAVSFATSTVTINLLVRDPFSKKRLDYTPFVVSIESGPPICENGHVLQTAGWTLPDQTEETKYGACKMCPPGTYTLNPLFGLDEFGNQTVGAPDCLYCPIGATCAGGTSFDGVGNWTSDGNMYILTSCPAGHTLVSGDYSPTGIEQFQHDLQRCVPCRTDGIEYIVAPETDNCRRCPVGLTCFGNESYTTIVPGSTCQTVDNVFTLRNCPSHYRVENSTEIEQYCDPCPSGEDCPDAECVTCQLCKPGTFKEAKGAFACKPCPANMYLNKSGAQSLHECIHCPDVAQQTGLVGATSRDQCICYPTYYLAHPDDDHICARCPDGAQCRDGTCVFSYGNQTCPHPLDLGGIGDWVRFEDGYMHLISCPAGFQLINSTDGDSTGTFAPQLQRCQKCNHGKQYIIDPNTHVCQFCPKFLKCFGTHVEPRYENASYEAVGSVYRLTQCPPGYWRDVGDDVLSQDCQTCGIGVDCTSGGCDGDESCMLCTAGKYKDSQNKFPCFNCPVGTYSSAIGATNRSQCEPCPYGAITMQDGQTSSDACVCGEVFYLKVGAGSGANVECVICPTGALCADGCAFAVGSQQDGVWTCPDGTKLIGEWELDAEGRYELLGCPAAYSLINSTTSSSSGVFDAEKQNCRKCNTQSQYILQPNSQACQACPPGLKCYGNSTVEIRLEGSDWELQSNVWVLLSCPAGYFASKPSLAEQVCETCEVGTKCLAAGCDACSLCDQGTYKSNRGEGDCLQCPKNTYGPSQGASRLSRCLACPREAVTNDVGQYSPYACDCDLQYYFSFSDSLGVLCNLCPPGGVCSNGVCGLRRNMNLSCAEGALVGRWERDANERFKVMSCPDGYMLVNSSGGTARGEFQHDVQNCRKCQDVTEYSLRPSVDPCQPCPPGLFCYGNSTVNFRVSGSRWETILDDNDYLRYSLIDCPSGYYRDGVNSFELHQCTVCPIGSECTAEHCTECSSCPAGTFKDAAGAAPCEECPVHTYGPSVGATALENCIQCQKYSFTSGTGQTSVDACVCDRSYYLSVSSQGEHSCMSCPVGARCGDLTCALWDPALTCGIVGDWSSGSDGLYRLTNCPDAYTLVNSSLGTSKGTFLHDGQQCRPCVSGANYIINPNTDTCQKCPPGLVCSGGRGVTEKQESEWVIDGQHWKLLSCGSGFYPYTGRDSFNPEVQVCLPCGFGEECTSTACTECSSCLPGKFKDSVSSEPCVDCPLNTFGPDAGATARSNCLQCPASSFSSSTGNTNASVCKCDARTYRFEEFGQVTCLTCPQGAVCTDGTCAFSPESTCPGQSLLFGSWMLQDGKYHLKGCPRGYQILDSIGGAWNHEVQQCRPCRPQFQYIIDSNKDTCQTCPPGLRCMGSNAVGATGHFAIVTEIPSGRNLSYGELLDVAPALQGSNWTSEGTVWRLISCPLGFKVIDSPTELQRCAPCGPGEQCLIDVCITCDPCPPGTYKDSDGTYACRPCPIGTYTGENGTNAVQGCFSCPTRAVTDSPGATVSDVCKCSVEDYVSFRQSPFECMRCPQGGICAQDLCVFGFDNLTCPEKTEPIIGTWSKDDDAVYRLRSCPDGHMLVNSSQGTSKGTFSHFAQRCRPCLQNQYVINSNTDSCQKCPPGLKCNGTRSVRPTVTGSVWEAAGEVFKLRTCPFGYSLFNETTVLQECKPCGLGLHCIFDVCFECSLCPEGYFKDSQGPIACKPCPVGTFAPYEGATSFAQCLQCPAYATTQSEASDKRDLCECNPTTYRATAQGGDFTCQQCPTGATCSDSNCGLASGGNCSDGNAIVGEWCADNVTGLNRLLSCPDGFRLVNSTSGTSRGTFFHDAQRCAACQPVAHYILNPNTDICQKCPPGLNCFGARYVDSRVNGSVWVENGTVYRLKSCPTGYYVYPPPGDFNAEIQQCLPCGIGQECTEEVCTTCSDCQPGTYKSAEGIDACKLCPVGTYGTEVAASSLSLCSNCPDGATTVGAGNSDPYACLCDARYYLVNTPGSGLSCIKCPEGAECVDSSCALQRENFLCERNPQIVGTWKRNKIDLFTIRSCPDGYMLINSTSVSSIGVFSHQAQQCRKCLDAEYVLSPSNDVCQKCPKGLRCQGNAQVFPRTAGARWYADGSVYKLQICPTGFYMDTPSQLLQQCAPCEAGEHCIEVNCSTCSPCPVGTYKESVGTYSCQPCPLNTYGPTIGARSLAQCTACPTGAVTQEVGEVNVSACGCQRGLYSSFRSSDGLFSCFTCPIGAKCQEGSCALANEDQICLSSSIVGEWTPDTDGRFLLTSCPDGYSLVNTLTGTGTFSYEGQRCQECLPNVQYIINPNEDVCQKCPPGLICDGTGSVISRLVGANWTVCSHCGSGGSAFQLISCPTGYSVSGNTLDQQQCAPCPLGSECSLDSCIECIPCKRGSYKQSTSPALCTICPFNTYNDAEGATAPAQCRACPRQSSTLSQGATAADECICSARTYLSLPPSQPVSRVCTNCPAGGRCVDGSCAFKEDPAACAGSGEPAGEWTREPVDDQLRLVGCPPGYSLINSTEGSSTGTFNHDLQQCRQCSTSQYILEPDRDACQKCPSGLICGGTDEIIMKVPNSTWVRAGDIYRLVTCAQGYKVENGKNFFDAQAQECVPCPAGEECALSQCTTCTECKAGKYKDLASADTCRECPTNTYNPVRGAKAAELCIACPVGATTAGPAQTDLSACTCDVRTYLAVDQRTGLQLCKTCPLGAICPDGTCALRNSNKRCTGDTTSIFNVTADVATPAPGVPGQDTSEVIGTWIQAEDGKYVLIDCPDGYALINSTDGSSTGVFSHDAQRCQSCRIDQYIIHPLFSCKPCPDGLLCRGVKAVEVVVFGSVWKVFGDIYGLVQCPTGYQKFAPDSPTTAAPTEIIQQDCLPCGRGEECTFEICDKCTLCIQGYYKDAISPVPCSPCPRNTFGTGIGAASQAECSPCPQGAVTVNDGETSSEACDCDIAQYKQSEDVSAGEISCSECPEGARCPSGLCALRADQERSCPDALDPNVTVPIIGTWERDSTGKYFLKSCPEGYSLVNTTDGNFLYIAQRCVLCLDPSQYVLDPNAHACQKCPPGLICNGTSHVQIREPGSQWEIIYDHFKLLSCPRGHQLFDTSLDTQECKPCPLGHECARDTCFDCTPCQPGTFKDTASAQDCLVCPRNTYGASSAATSLAQCTNCPRFSQTEFEASALATDCKCSPSTYQAISQDQSSQELSCLTCPTGAVCNDDTCGLSSPTLECPTASFNSTRRLMTTEGERIVGTWNRMEDGSFKLAGCPSGYSLITALDGTSSGTFFHDAQQCKKCSNGFNYILSPNADDCQRCPPGLICYGNETVTSVVAGAQWVVNGSIFRLVSCPTGYSRYLGRGGVFTAQAQECRPCEKGLECTAEKCTECTPCPQGTYKEVIGSGVCQPCPANFYGSDIGASSFAQCRACPRWATTSGSGNTNISACVCASTRYKVEPQGSQPICKSCPLGASCSELDHRECALARADKTCPSSDTAVLGSWARDSRDWWVLLGCPDGTSLINSTEGSATGTFNHDGQQCSPCLQCPTPGEYCSSGEYVVDPNKFKCKACPKGAQCNGVSLRTRRSLDLLGARWGTNRPKNPGEMWLEACPIGHRMITKSGYENQECLQCPVGQFVYDSTNPNHVCNTCPAGGVCPNRGPPIFGGKVLSAAVSVDGMFDSVEQAEADDKGKAILTRELEQMLSAAGGVEIIGFCDPNTESCSESGNGRRNYQFRALLQASNVSQGIVVVFEVITRDQTAEELTARIGNGGFASNLTQAIAAADPAYANIAVPPPRQPVIANPPSSRGEEYLITSDGKATLVGCDIGYLLVNDTIKHQQCQTCNPTFYSLNPMDYCPSPDQCTLRDCSRCPKGATCEGGDHFVPNVPSRWGRTVYRKEDGSSGLVNRLEQCGPGNTLVRNEIRPEDDQCVTCPPDTFSLEEAEHSQDFLTPTRADMVRSAAGDLCLGCPQGAECPGGVSVAPVEGYWRGRNMICPVAHCDVNTNVCDPAKCEKVGSRLPGRDFEHLWRLRVMVYKCPRGMCPQRDKESGNATDGIGNICRKGHKGKLCAICEEGWAMTGFSCMVCGDFGIWRTVIVASIIGLFMVFWYLAAWRPLLKQVEDSIFDCLRQLVAPCKNPRPNPNPGIFTRMTNKVKGGTTDFLKIYIGFWQVAGGFVNSVNVDWPPTLSTFFVTMSSIFQLDLLAFPGLSCMTSNVSYKSKLISTTLFIPFVISFMAVPSIVCKIACRKKFIECYNLFMFSTLFFLFATYAATAMVVLRAFACVNLGADGHFLKSDLTTICPYVDPDPVTFWWAAVSLLLYPLGVPAFMICIMIWHGVPKAVNEKRRRAFLIALLHKFKTQNAVPMKVAQELGHGVDAETLDNRLKKELWQAARAVGKAAVTEFGVHEFRVLLERLGFIDVGYSELQGMIDRYGHAGTIDKTGITIMVKKCLRVQHILTGDEDPDSLNIVQLRELSAAGRFEVSLYRPGKTHHNHAREAMDEDDDDPLPMGRSMKQKGSMKFDKFEHKELLELLVRRAGLMEKKGELAVPETKWDGATQVERDAIDRVGFLFNTYKCRYWWFEFADISRKLLMSMIVVFVFDGTPSQVAVGLAVTLGVLFLSLLHKPYINPTLGAMQMYSLAIQAVTYFYGIMLATAEFDEIGGQSDSAQAAVMGMFVLCLNGMLILIPLATIWDDVVPTKGGIKRFLLKVGVPRHILKLEEPEEKSKHPAISADITFDEDDAKAGEVGNLVNDFMSDLEKLKTFLKERRKQAGGDFVSDDEDGSSAGEESGTAVQAENGVAYDQYSGSESPRSSIPPDASEHRLRSDVQGWVDPNAIHISDEASEYGGTASMHSADPRAALSHHKSMERMRRGLPGVGAEDALSSDDADPRFYTGSEHGDSRHYYGDYAAPDQSVDHEEEDRKRYLRNWISYNQINPGGMDFEEYVQWEAHAGHSTRPELRHFTFTSKEFRRQFMDGPDSSESDDSFDSLNSENRDPESEHTRSMRNDPDNSFADRKTWWEKRSAKLGSFKNMVSRHQAEVDDDDDDPYMAVSAEVGFAEQAQRAPQDEAIAQEAYQQKEHDKMRRKTVAAREAKKKLTARQHAPLAEQPVKAFRPTYDAPDDSRFQKEMLHVEAVDVGFMSADAMAQSQARLQAQRILDQAQGLGGLSTFQGESAAMDVGSILHGDEAPLARRHAKSLQERERPGLRSTLRPAPTPARPARSGRRGSIEAESTTLMPLGAAGARRRSVEGRESRYEVQSSLSNLPAVLKAPRSKRTGAGRRNSIEADSTVTAPPHATNSQVASQPPAVEPRFQKPKLLPSFKGNRRGSMEVGESLFAPAPVAFLAGRKTGRKRSVEMSADAAEHIRVLRHAQNAARRLEEAEGRAQTPEMEGESETISHWSRSRPPARGDDDTDTAGQFVSDLKGWLGRE